MASYPVRYFQQCTKHHPPFFSHPISHHSLLLAHSKHTAAVWARSGLRAFALIAPSAWNALPPGICLLISAPPSRLSCKFTFPTKSILVILFNTATCSFYCHQPDLLHSKGQHLNYYTVCLRMMFTTYFLNIRIPAQGQKSLLIWFNDMSQMHRTGSILRT